MKKSSRINWPKLLREFAIVAAIAFVVIGTRVLPELLGRPIYDSYSNYKLYYRMALDYDYTQGPNIDLEKQLIEASKNTQISPDHLFYNRLALGIYYTKADFPDIALSRLYAASELSADPVQLKQVWRYILECEQLLGDKDRINAATNVYNVYAGYPDDV